MSEFKINDVVNHTPYGRGVVIAFRQGHRAVVQFRDHDGFHGRLPLIVNECELTLAEPEYVLTDPAEDEWCLLDLQAALITYVRPMPKCHRSRVARGIRKNDLDALRYAFPATPTCPAPASY